MTLPLKFLMYKVIKIPIKLPYPQFRSTDFSSIIKISKAFMHSVNGISIFFIQINMLSPLSTFYFLVLLEYYNIT